MIDINTYYIIKSIVLIGFLIFFSVEDIRERKISTKIIMVMASAGILIVCLTLSLDLILKSLMCAMVTGAVSYITYLLSKKGLGIGDVLLLTATGIYIGDLTMIFVVFISLLSLALFSAGGLIIKKINIKSQLPYVPFLLIGVIVGSLI